VLGSDFALRVTLRMSPQGRELLEETPESIWVIALESRMGDESKIVT
jgi:hypothetical protein